MLSWSQPHWYTTCFSIFCFSHQPPPPLHLPQSLLPQGHLSKSQACLSLASRGVAAVNLCIFGLIESLVWAGQKVCRRLCSWNEGMVMTVIKTICQVAADCSIRVRAARVCLRMIAARFAGSGLKWRMPEPLNIGWLWGCPLKVKNLNHQSRRPRVMEPHICFICSYYSARSLRAKLEKQKAVNFTNSALAWWWVHASRSLICVWRRTIGQGFTLSKTNNPVIKSGRNTK